MVKSHLSFIFVFTKFHSIWRNMLEAKGNLKHFSYGN